MPTDTTHSKQADGRAMTLGELRAFVAELDQLGAADSTAITGAVRGLDGKVTRLTGKVVRFGAPEELGELLS